MYCSGFYIVIYTVYNIDHYVYIIYSTVHILLFTCTIITVYCCSRLSVVAVVDLSKPEEIWNTLEVFIKQVHVI